MNEDTVLLSRYIDEASEEAFRSLVTRHVDLVYAAAMRRTGGDAQRAADVAQEVFTALARQAAALRRHPALGAWLHTATRNIAINLMRSEQRRELRQHAAIELETTQASTTEPQWERLRPVLDAAIDELPEHDRRAVVFRFLEQRGFAQIGAALGVSEDAARMRTERALDKLRGLLARRGITSTSAALAAIVSTHANGAAPAGLATMLAAKSVAAASSGGSLLGVMATFATAKVVGIVIASAGLAFVCGVVVSRGASARATMPTVASVTDERHDALREENRRLKAELEQMRADMQRLAAAHSTLLTTRSPTSAAPSRVGGVLGAPLPRHEVQRNVLHNLRMMAAAIDQYKHENKRWPTSIDELVGATAYIRRLVPVDGEDYTSLALNGGTLSVTTMGGVTVSYGDGGVTTRVESPPAVARVEELQKKVERPAQAAREAYRLANRGKDPAEEEALIPFFATPEQGADFVELLEAKKNVPK